AALDTDDMNTQLEQTNSEQGKLIRLTVPGMGSDHCAGIVRESLQRLEGIERIETNIASHHVSISPREGGPDAGTLKTAVEKAGYDVARVTTDSDHGDGDESDIDATYLRQAWKRLWIAAV